MGDDEVQKLAESLKSSGLAASITDAINKAKEILGYSNKGVKIRVENLESKQEKVDNIIKEVDKEIKKPVEPKSKLDDPSFNIADSDMKVKDLGKPENEVLEQEANIEAEKEEISTVPENMIRTNDELKQETLKTEEIREKEDTSQTPDKVEKSELTKEEKEKTDLSKLFNFSNK